MATNNVGYSEEQIQVLEGLEPVRKRPGMYIGSTDVKGLHHLAVEIVDNSIDEALAGYCKNVYITVNADGSLTIADDGRGIPCGIHKKEGISAVELCLTKLHAGGKFGGGGYKISGGLHGVGLSVVNALSCWLVVEVDQDGKHHYQRYNRGVPESRLQVTGEADRTGTTVTFMPDDEIFETVEWEYDRLKNRLREVAYLNKGIKINLKDCREGCEREEVFCYEGGLAEFVENYNRTKNTIFSQTMYIDKAVKEGQIEVALQFNDSYTEVIHAYANNINTEEGGAHLEGFKSALTKAINDYAHKTNLLKEAEKLSGEDVREGLVAIISVKLENPQFEGQTKTKLGNSEMRTA
ncbi:MAG: DNA topoisomerase IV subunit B, partial [Clostridia bacterium]|nr:DNA topoisomerase IV subunit B [Clostridia bacterium]